MCGLIYMDPKEAGKHEEDRTKKENGIYCLHLHGLITLIRSSWMRAPRRDAI